MSSDLILLFSGLGLAATSVYLFVSVLLSSNADTNALAWASGNEPSPSKSGLINFSRPLIHNFTLQHAQRIKNKKYRTKIRKSITKAGLVQEINEDEYIGMQILWGLMFPLFLLVLNFALQVGYPYWICIALGGLGLYFPKLYCNQQSKSRYTSIVSDLPFFTDLLALSTEAGLEFISAVQRIVDKAENSPLADEFNQVLKDIRLGQSRNEALRAMATRLDIPEVTSFCSVVTDASDTGASIGSVLKEQSEQMRMERFVRAEKAGAQASQMVLLPMMIFILPAVFIMVFAPVVIQMFYGGS